MPDRKVIFIGLDAGTLKLVRLWAGQGRLRNLSRFLQSGAVGELRSTLPPQSPAAWSTFITGLNPGKHGVLSFVDQRAGSYEPYLANATHCHGIPFWEHAGQQGISVGMLNIPFTYPPRPCNGFLISGMLSPGVDRRMASPPEVFDDLVEISPKYAVEVDVVRRESKRVRSTFLQRTIVALQARKKAAVGLYRKYRPDLFGVVFTASDRVSHFFWHDYELCHKQPHTGERVNCFATAIRTVYEELDAAVGELLEVAGEDTDVVILSDHGAGPLRKMFSLRKALAREGLLREAGSAWLRGVKKSSILAGARLCPATLIQRIQKLFPGLSSWAVGQVSGGIDFRQTLAYPAEEADAVFVNLKGRQPQGIVEPGKQYERIREEVIRLFGDIRDPDSGQLVFKGAYRCEDVWTGPHVGQMPDVVLEQRDWLYESTITTAAYGQDVFSPLRGASRAGLHYTGGHTRDGLLLAHGPHIRGGEVRGASLADVPATILALLQCPIPQEFDGRVLTEMLTDDVAATRRTGRTATARGRTREFTDEEKRAVEKRLKGLGYL